MHFLADLSEGQRPHVTCVHCFGKTGKNLCIEHTPVQAGYHEEYKLICFIHASCLDPNYQQQLRGYMHLLSLVVWLCFVLSRLCLHHDTRNVICL